MNVRIGLAVPVLTNFEGFTRLMASVDIAVKPYVIPNYDENKGVSWAWNEGIRRARIDNITHLLISNDDIVYERGCIETLVHAMQGDNSLDVASAVNTRDFPEMGSGSIHEVDFAAFMVRPLTFMEKFGSFDEHFTPAYFEDNDMYRRIELAQGLQRKILSARMYHKGSQTQFYGGGRVVSHDQFDANRAYYAAKWGGWPGEETYDAPFNGVTGKTYKQW